MKPTILVTHALPKRGLEPMFAKYRVLYPEQAYTFTQSELMTMAPEVDAVLACGAITAEFVAAARRLKVVSNYGVGYDSVNVAALTARSIPLTNLPDEVAYPTAELAMALLLSVSRRVAELNHRLRAEAPEHSFGLGKYMGHSLQGRTLGIVGMGSIGGRVANMARAFGMRIAYYNRRELPPELAGDAAYLPLDELMRTSDVISLHCPLTPATRGLINAERIAMMRSDAVLINTSRGAVVDMDALIDALRAGRIGGAGLDVYPDEPHIPETLLLLDNAVLTPHIGSNTIEARAQMAAQAYKHIEQVLAGKRPDHIVNPEVYQ